MQDRVTHSIIFPTVLIDADGRKSALEMVAFNVFTHMCLYVFTNKQSRGRTAAWWRGEVAGGRGRGGEGEGC